MIIGRHHNSYIWIAILLILSLIYWNMCIKKKQMVVNIESDAGVDVTGLVINLKLFSEIDEDYTATETITVYYKGQQLKSSLDINNIYGYEFYINFDDQCFNNYYSDYIYYPFNENIIQNIKVKELNNQLLFLIQPAYLESKPDSYVPKLKSYSSCDTKLLDKASPNYKYYNDLFEEAFREIKPLDEDIVNYYATIPEKQLKSKNILPEDLVRIYKRKELLSQDHANEIDLE